MRIFLTGGMGLPETLTGRAEHGHPENP